jgi:hypothetical protein
MIAAAGHLTRTADRRLDRLAGKAPGALSRWTRQADRRLYALAGPARVAARKRWRKARPVLLRWRRWTGKRLRPVAAFVLRAVAAGERAVRGATAAATRAMKRIRGVMSPRRVALCLVVASSLALVVSQFIEYRAIEIGQPGYAGLPTAQPPTIEEKTAGQAHAYLLVPLGLLAAGLALRAIRRPKPAGLGLTIAALGLAGLAVVLLVDLPAGLDEGAAASQFSGATATLRDGFSIELAACVGLILGGLLYYARPCRTRTNLYARAVSALRRRPRRRASSRGRATRSGSPRRNAAASAPASRP